MRKVGFARTDQSTQHARSSRFPADAPKLGPVLAFIATVMCYGTHLTMPCVMIRLRSHWLQSVNLSLPVNKWQFLMMMMA